MNAAVKTPRFALTALVSTGVGLAGLGLAPVTAHADPTSDWGPAKHWCPGEPLPATGNHVTDRCMTGTRRSATPTTTCGPEWATFPT